jgi:hypothetical protein
MTQEPTNPGDYMSPDEAHELDACPVCNRIQCICEPDDDAFDREIREHKWFEQPYVNLNE